MTRAEVPDLVFAGTSVAAGAGKAVVFATGMNTEFGKIAHLTQTIVDAPSPLEKELDRATKIVTVNDEYAHTGRGFSLLPSVFFPLIRVSLNPKQLNGT
jgi:hypothetical protein